MRDRYSWWDGNEPAGERAHFAAGELGATDYEATPLHYARALELVTVKATAPGAAFAAMAPNSGNSLTVRNARADSYVALLQVWADVQGAGTFRLRSPRLHDNNQGIRLDTVVGDVVPLLPWGIPEPLIPQDPLTAEIIGSAVAGDVESVGMLIYYDDLPGAEAQLRSYEEIAGRIRHIVAVENTLALGTTGDYSGEEAINAEFDLLKANTEYALIGYFTDAEAACIRYRGADTGNYGLGGPGEPGLRHITKDWFLLLSQAYGLPLIPCLNFSNRAGILIDGQQDENGTDVTVTSLFAELG